MKFNSTFECKVIYVFRTNDGNKNNLRKLILYTIFSVLIFAIVIYLILYLLVENIVDIFNSENSIELSKIAIQGIRLYFWTTACVVFNIVFAMLFTATEKALPTLLLYYYAEWY